MGCAVGGIGAELIAAVHHRHPYAPRGHHLPMPGGDREGDPPGRHQRPARQQRVARAKIKPARADMAAGRRQIGRSDRAIGHNGIFLQQHPVRPCGNQRAG